MLLPSTLHSALAIAQSSEAASGPLSVFGAIPAAVILGLAVAVVLGGLALMLVNRYVRCPANKILVISGPAPEKTN